MNNTSDLNGRQAASAGQERPGTEAPSYDKEELEKIKDQLAQTMETQQNQGLHNFGFKSYQSEHMKLNLENAKGFVVQNTVSGILGGIKLEKVYLTVDYAQTTLVVRQGAEEEETSSVIGIHPISTIKEAHAAPEVKLS